MLPELRRALLVVDELLAQAIDGVATTQAPMTEAQGDLPWLQQQNDECDDSDSIPGIFSVNGNIEEPVDEEPEPVVSTLGLSPIQPRQQYDRRQLEMLAPLLDRLGRTLVDAAPHIASFSATLPEGCLAEDSNEDDSLQDGISTRSDAHQPPLGGLLSLLTRDRRRQSRTSDATLGFDLTASGVDPDHVDFASGLVNTSRGEVRGGPRSRSSNDDVANLLGAYLAAASLSGLTNADDSDNDDNGNGMSGLGRLLRDRGNGGGAGGIDIHIHAVVTAPGGATGGLGFATLGGGGPATATLGTRNLFSTRERRSQTSLIQPSRIMASLPQRSDDGDDEESLGLFSELYSENPTPVDPNGSPVPVERRADPEETMADGEDASNFVRNTRMGTIMRSDSLTLTPTRRSMRSNGFSPHPSSRENSERRSGGWGRLFRRRSRTNHGQQNNNEL